VLKNTSLVGKMLLKNRSLFASREEELLNVVGTVGQKLKGVCVLPSLGY